MPRGFVWGAFLTPDGAKLRWGHLPGATPRAHFVLVSGFGDFIEKQFETVRDLADRGFAVWCLDWRGQGGSTRPTRWPNRPRARRFERDAEELAAFIRRYLPQDQPRVLVAHSMGGAIALLCLHRDPGLFDAVVLSAPKFGLVTGRAPWALRLVTLPARYSVLGLCRLPGSRRWHPTEPPTPDRSLITSDPERCKLRYAWVTADPRLALHQPTYAWLDPALALLTRIHRPQFLAQICTPILLGSPGREYVVARSAHRRVARHLPDCTFVELPHSKHEAALEVDAIRDGWLARIDRFVAERIEGRAVNFAESAVTVDVLIDEATRIKRGPPWPALTHYLGGTGAGRLLHETRRLGWRFTRLGLRQGGGKRLRPARTSARSR
jgi:lysophospholipase